MIDASEPASPGLGLTRLLPRSSRLRPLHFVLFLVAVLLIQSALRADTIVLKNGRRINAESVSEEGDKVFYESEGGRVSLSKSLVERIEKNDLAPQSQPRSPSASPSAAALEKALSLEISVPQKDVEGIVHNGQVDEKRLELLASLAEKGDMEAKTAVNAYLVAAAFEAQHDRLAQANRWAEEALRLSTVDLNALLVVAQIDILRRQFSEALNHLLLAQSLQSDSPDVLTLLGYAYYYLEGPEKANRFWKQAYTLRPERKLQELMRQTEIEEQVEARLAQSQSSHFVLNTEGSSISESFRASLLDTLEQQFRDLESELDYDPRDPIVVTLYPAQDFKDITRAPGWAGAVNDGKIRVPVRGLSSLTPQLARVLKHEMTHSFVHGQTQGHCPTWFNEGLAQVESGEVPSLPGAGLTVLYGESRQIPLSQLEGSFMQLNSTLASIAYAESQATVAMIRAQYGAYQLPQLLKLLGEGKSMAEALQRALGIDYPELETELARYLTQR